MSERPRDWNAASYQRVSAPLEGEELEAAQAEAEAEGATGDEAESASDDES